MSVFLRFYGALLLLAGGPFGERALLFNSNRSVHSIYSIGKQTDEICKSVIDLISVFRFRLLTKDYEITKF